MWLSAFGCKFPGILKNRSVYETSGITRSVMTHSHIPEYLNIQKYHFENFRASHGLILYENLFQNKNSDFCAPLTSFDWNEVDPNLIGTSSIDTTCTIWGLETGQVSSYMFLCILNRITVCLLFVFWFSILVHCLSDMCLYRSQSCQSEVTGKYCGSVVVLLCHGEVHTQFLTQRPTALIESVLGCGCLLQENNWLVDCWYDCFLLNPLDSEFTHPSVQCCVTCADKEVPKRELCVAVWLWCQVECLSVPKYLVGAELQSYSVSDVFK